MSAKIYIFKKTYIRSRGYFSIYITKVMRWEPNLTIKWANFFHRRQTCFLIDRADDWSVFYIVNHGFLEHVISPFSSTLPNLPPLSGYKSINHLRCVCAFRANSSVLYMADRVLYRVFIDKHIKKSRRTSISKIFMRK